MEDQQRHKRLSAKDQRFITGFFQDFRMWGISLRCDILSRFVLMCLANASLQLVPSVDVVRISVLFCSVDSI